MATEVLVSTGSLAPQSVRAPALFSMHRPDSRARVGLGGIYIDSVDQHAAAAQIREFVGSGKPHQVVTVNLDFISIANRNPMFQDTINRADLAVADGMPLVWLSRL